MFQLFKKKYALVDSGILQGMTDLHSHLLPGVDDGSPDTASSLEMLAWMEALGIRKVWFTPHVMEDFQNNSSRLEQVFQTFQQAYTGPIELNLASEYMLDVFLIQRRIQIKPRARGLLITGQAQMMLNVTLTAI